MYGSHIPQLGSLQATLKDADQQGMTAVQMFCGSPYSLDRKSFTAEDIKSTKENIKGITSVYSHLPYVLNLAGKAKTNSIAWQGDHETDGYTTSCCNSISAELKTLGQLKSNKGCASVGCGCVLHIGSIGTNKARKEGLLSVAKSINKIAWDPSQSSKLLLETMVGNKGVLGTSFEELSWVYNNLEEAVKPRVGICIDTCHVFAEGKYNLAMVEQVDDMFKEFDAVLPPCTLQLIHLNDSKECFGSHKDRHAMLQTGYVWKDSSDGLVHLLKHAKQRNLGVVLETETNDWSNLQKLLIDQKLL